MFLNPENCFKPALLFFGNNEAEKGRNLNKVFYVWQFALNLPKLPNCSKSQHSKCKNKVIEKVIPFI